MSEPIIIDLGPNQSAKLSAAASDWASVFVVSCRQSAPEDPTRWRLHLVKADVKSTTDALAIIEGTAKAVRPKAAKH